MPTRRAVALFLILTLVSLPVLAQNGGNTDLLARIRKEAMDRSQIMNRNRAARKQLAAAQKILANVKEGKPMVPTRKKIQPPKVQPITQHM